MLQWKNSENAFKILLFLSTYLMHIDKISFLFAVTSSVEVEWNSAFLIALMRLV